MAVKTGEQLLEEWNKLTDKEKKEMQKTINESLIWGLKYGSTKT